MVCVEPGATYPQWELYAVARGMLGPTAFDAATADWLPQQAAEALAAAGPPYNEESLYNGLWMLGLEHETLLANLEAAGVPREFPLEDAHPPRHWRVLLHYWLESVPVAERSKLFASHVARSWGSDPSTKIADPRALQRICWVLEEYGFNDFNIEDGPVRVGDAIQRTGSVAVLDLQFALTAEGPEAFVPGYDPYVLGLLEQYGPPEGFELRRYQGLLADRVGELEGAAVPTSTLASARLSLERARRLVGYYLD